MKNYTILFFFVVVLVNSCGKEETKLEAFNPEAFAYDLGNTWEVNAMINVRGFEQRVDKGETFEASVSYYADIKTPNGKMVEKVFIDKINVSEQEEIIDIPLEVQFELDSTYSNGKYTIIFNITDMYSQASVTGAAEFNLSE
jgi:hypothetical protein